jgi:hypothetical protein
MSLTFMKLFMKELTKHKSLPTFGVIQKVRQSKLLYIFICAVRQMTRDGQQWQN